MAMLGFVCENCGKYFEQRKHYDQHRRRKTPCGTTFQCPKCSKSFPNQRELTRHLGRKTPCATIQVVITNDNPENQCHSCGSTYANKSNLTRHQKTCKVLHEDSDDLSEMNTLMNEITESNQSLQLMREDLEQLSIGMVGYNKIIEKLKEENARLQEENEELKAELEACQDDEEVYIQGDKHYQRHLIRCGNQVAQWVYFIKEHRAEPRIKIGLTKCLTGRIRNLQTSNSDKLEIIAFIRCHDMHQTEDYFHELFDDQRLNGEWFELTEEEIFETLQDYRN